MKNKHGTEELNTEIQRILKTGEHYFCNAYEQITKGKVSATEFCIEERMTGYSLSEKAYDSTNLSRLGNC